MPLRAARYEAKMLGMGVNYAIREKKSAMLATDFAREFVTRHFGQQAADAIYEVAPRYKRGPNKGQPKGWVVWTKCIKGGWVRTGSYDGDAMRGQGYVMAPGTHEVAVTFIHPNYVEGRPVTLDAGQRRGLPTDANRETDEQWAIRCKRAVLQMTNQPVPKELEEAPVVVPFSEKQFIENVMRCVFLDASRANRTPDLGKPETAHGTVAVLLVEALAEAKS